MIGEWMARLWRSFTMEQPTHPADPSWLDEADRMRKWDGPDPDRLDRPWLYEGGVSHATYANLVERLGKQEADRFNDVVRRANETGRSS
jgi:hypothetical protein